MLNSLTIPTPLPTAASAFLAALVLGICKIIFPRELLYILNSYSVQDLQLPWQYLWQEKKRERARERGREGAKKKKKGKVFRADREITGFIIFSQLILSITNDRATAGTLKELVFVFER